MPASLKTLAGADLSPIWDKPMCNKLLSRPILCEQNIHKDFASRVHQHIGIEFILCKSGEGVLYLNNRPYPYRAPVLVRIECQIPHNVAVNGIYDRWNVCIEPNSLGRFLAADLWFPINELYDRPAVSMVPVTEALTHRLENLFIDISYELSMRQVYYEKITLLHLQELSCLFDRLSHDACENNAASLKADAGQMNQLIKIRAYIEANLADDISARSIAAAFHYNEKYVYRLVQKLTGLPLGAYLKSQRIQRAISLLESTDLPVAAVGLAVGIKHPVLFSRTFHTVTGLCPSAYRAKHRTPFNESH